jgi:hypothetical protein
MSYVMQHAYKLVLCKAQLKRAAPGYETVQLLISGTSCMKITKHCCVLGWQQVICARYVQDDVSLLLPCVYS